MLYINRASRSVREASVSDDGKLLFAETEHETEKIGELSNMMGHSNTSTTLHYFKKTVAK